MKEDCFQPGWNSGPDENGNLPESLVVEFSNVTFGMPKDWASGYVCELDHSHEGPHAWGLWKEGGPVEWPISAPSADA